MNSRFRNHLIADAFLWALIFCGLIVGNDLASSALSFWLWTLCVMVFVVVISWSGKGYDDKAKMVGRMKHGKRTKAHKTYSVFSTIAEATILASAGWFVTAAAWLIASMLMSDFTDEMDRIQDELGLDHD